MLITLLTDFGTADYFVGAMKGAIFSVNPDARVVDITHDIPAHDVQAGAWTLLAACQIFPTGSVHVGVVDPGVGSSRRPILIAQRERFFVGPDNGLLSYLIDPEANPRVFHLTNERYFRRPVSATFHGRDIFAPVAAWLTRGVAPEEFGEPVANYTRLAALTPVEGEGGVVEATIIHVDRFGNCITNITRRDLSEKAEAQGACLIINNQEIRSFRRFFAEEAVAASQSTDELFAVWGSAGFLEIAGFRRSAAGLLKAERGQKVTLIAG
ncbi:MAG: SAM-dependent chlorinase/fluorinase [Pyrinomonadaceae bacterium]|nr:SAM-dependent chlorinase/fluorinase [Pyrinomonadaceae bacterium]